MERNNERKRRNYSLQGSQLEKDKTITPPNSSKMGYDYGVRLFFLNHSQRYAVNLLNVRFTRGLVVDIADGVFDQIGDSYISPRNL